MTPQTMVNRRVVEDFEDDYQNIGGEVEMGELDENDDLVETDRRMQQLHMVNPNN